MQVQPRQDALTEFGNDVYEFATQPCLQLSRWSPLQYNGAPGGVVAHYWVADANGDFRFGQDMPPVGRELHGAVKTSVARSAGRRASGDRGAVDDLLAEEIIGYRSAQDAFDVDIASDEGRQLVAHWKSEIGATPSTADTLLVGGEPHTAISVRFGGFTARSARIGDVVITTVLRDDEAAALDGGVVLHS